MNMYQAHQGRRGEERNLRKTTLGLLVKEVGFMDLEKAECKYSIYKNIVKTLKKKLKKNNTTESLYVLPPSFSLCSICFICHCFTTTQYTPCLQDLPAPLNRRCQHDQLAYCELWISLHFEQHIVVEDQVLACVCRQSKTPWKLRTQ